VEECGPCPVFASFTLAFALQLRKKHKKPRSGQEKPQSKYSTHITKNTHTLQYSHKHTHYKTHSYTHTHTQAHIHTTKQYKTTTVQIKIKCVQEKQQLWISSCWYLWRFDTPYEEMVAAGKAKGVEFCINVKIICSSGVSGYWPHLLTSFSISL
jgi:hypothetical protein